MMKTSSIYNDVLLSVGGDVPAWVWQLLAVMVIVFLLVLVYLLAYRREAKRMTRTIRRNNSRLALVLRTSGVRVWVLDIAKKVVTTYDFSNRAPFSEQPLREFLSNVVSEDVKRIEAALSQIADQTEDQKTLDVKIIGEKDGAVSTLTLGLSVLHRSRDGRPVSILGTTTDVTEDHMRQSQVKDNMLRYRSIFNSIMVDTVTYDADGYMTDMNEKASQAFPGGREAALANHFHIRDVLGDALPPLDQMQTIHLTRIFDADADRRVFNKELHDKRMYYELQLVPIRNAEGKLLTIFGTGRDVTEMVHSYRTLQQKGAQMRLLNQEMNTYIQNVEFVLKNGGMRLVKYSPVHHTLTFYSGIGQIENELTQARALGLAADEESKREAQRLLNNMDNLCQTTLSATVKTYLPVRKDRRLALYFSIVPTTDDEGRVTEYFGMCRDITEIKAAEEQLAAETAKAQELEKLKTSFLRNMSYEIRTPLNSVVGFAELFSMEHDAADESYFINEIKDNSAHLLKLINDILFLSRLDARMIEINKKPIDFAAFFEPRCQVAWLGHPAEGVDFVVDNPYQRLVLELDEQNLGLVIDQIVTNAAEHTTSGQVHLFYEYTGEELVMAFQDTGSGIPPERMKEIFERFGSTTSRGTGLGLAICHEMVQQMGGKINIKSEVGKGTIVWVTIPCYCSEIVRK